MNQITFPSVTSGIQGMNKTEGKGNASSPAQAQKDFASFLKDSIAKVNDVQNESDKLTTKLALGENVDLHQVMIASQKASITLSATLEIRNKAVEAYQEMMRMQV